MKKFSKIIFLLFFHTINSKFIFSQPHFLPTRICTFAKSFLAKSLPYFAKELIRQGYSEKLISAILFPMN